MPPARRERAGRDIHVAMRNAPEVDRNHPVALIVIIECNVGVLGCRDPWRQLLSGNMRQRADACIAGISCRQTHCVVIILGQCTVDDISVGIRSIRPATTIVDEDRRGPRQHIVRVLAEVPSSAFSQVSGIRPVRGCAWKCLVVRPCCRQTPLKPHQSHRWGFRFAVITKCSR